MVSFSLLLLLLLLLIFITIEESNVLHRHTWRERERGREVVLNYRRLRYLFLPEYIIISTYQSILQYLFNILILYACIISILFFAFFFFKRSSKKFKFKSLKYSKYVILISYKYKYILYKPRQCY